MKCLVGYPPIVDSRGYVQIGQNRQSKIFSVGEEAAIFPCVMAWAATLLKHDGHEVIWCDAQTQGLSSETFFRQVRIQDPDLILWEAKTPSIKATWEAVRQVKQILPHCLVVLCGDHVTALPEESVTNAPVDIVLTGGDYDFGIRRLVKLFQQPDIDNPLGNDRVFHPGTVHDVVTLPVIDRALCRWKDYSRMGNYLRLPGTHGYSARDCWWRHEGGCTFCSWTNTYKNYRTMSVNQFMADVESAHALGAREYFDDAGTWAPPGRWFDQATRLLTVLNGSHRHPHARITMGCNDRPGARGREEYIRMANAGFRFVLFGLESANLQTLQRINKGQQAEDMRNAAKWASEAGLQPHLTVMLGYPWETREDAQKTVGLVRTLFDRGWANSMQATLLMPYPGTKLFSDAQANGWLLTTDWNRYTMNECILKCPLIHEEVLEKIQDCYKAAVTPRYILKKVLTVRTRDDLRFFWRGFKFWWGHLTDFGQLNSRRP